MNDCQKKFFQHLAVIQNEAVQKVLSRYDKKMDIASVLYDATYEVIAGLMVTIDGYSGFCGEQMDLINCETGRRLEEHPFLELHDQLENFLQYS